MKYNTAATIPMTIKAIKTNPFIASLLLLLLDGKATRVGLSSNYLTLFILVVRTSCRPGVLVTTQTNVIQTTMNMTVIKTNNRTSFFTILMPSVSGHGSSAADLLCNTGIIYYKLARNFFSGHVIQHCIKIDKICQTASIETC